MRLRIEREMAHDDTRVAMKFISEPLRKSGMKATIGRAAKLPEHMHMALARHGMVVLSR